MNTQTAERIEVWRDSTSDPETPVWCVSLCADDGEEIRCLDTTDDHDAGIASGREEARQRDLPLYCRDRDGGCTLLAQWKRDSKKHDRVMRETEIGR